MSAKDETMSSFEARSLPPDSLTKPYGHYTVVADRLPDCWAIDVSPYRSRLRATGRCRPVAVHGRDGQRRGRGQASGVQDPCLSSTSLPSSLHMSRGRACGSFAMPERCS